MQHLLLSASLLEVFFFFTLFAPPLFRISSCQLEPSLLLLPLFSNLSLAHNFCRHMEHTCETHTPPPPKVHSLTAYHSDHLRWLRSPPSPPSTPRHIVTGMLVASYMTSVVPLHCYQFLYLRISSNFPFYLLVLLVSGRLPC